MAELDLRRHKSRHVAFHVNKVAIKWQIRAIDHARRARLSNICFVCALIRFYDVPTNNK